MAHLSRTTFFWYKALSLLSSNFWPFLLRKIFKKILKADPELWGCAIFGPKMIHLPRTKFFLEKNYIFFIYLLAPFVVQNFKKIFTADPELCRCTILGSKMDHLPKWEFFRKPANKPYSFQSCLSTCQKSKSDINLLMKYRQLKNTEISLAKSHFRL